MFINTSKDYNTPCIVSKNDKYICYEEELFINYSIYLVLSIILISLLVYIVGYTKKLTFKIYKKYFNCHDFEFCHLEKCKIV